MKRNLLLFCFLSLATIGLQAQTPLRLTSPDGRISVDIQTNPALNYRVTVDGREVLSPSPIDIQFRDGTSWSSTARLRRSVARTHRGEVASPFYRADKLSDRYNQLTLTFRNRWQVEFRAYDDGVAYRFVYEGKKPLYVKREKVEYRFPADFEATVPYVNRGNDGDFESQYPNSFENIYTTAPLSELNAGRLSFLPLLIDAGEGVKLCLTESDITDYPGLYLVRGEAERSLVGHFAPYPKVETQGGHNNLQSLVTEREDYAAHLAGSRTLPWRVAVVARQDKELAASNLTYLLGAPSKVDDISWIKPGKVAWEWWNALNLYGVDFETGINNPTYHAYIDFAAQKGIEYVILDEGWSVHGKADLMQVVPEIDLEEIVRYADARHVGIILWAGYQPFARDLEKVCKHYADMGVKGFKVDFLDRDDQKMVSFISRAAEVCAKYHLVLDFHGTFKPAGFNRTYPHILNFEGVHGLEQLKWRDASCDQVKYDVQLPFLRQVAGPMDYTQGAMHNAAKGNYRPIHDEPMSQGTRCRQLALYLVLDSPLNMLCDSPSNYLREAECTDFIASVPTVWDETRLLDGRVGEYIITARRKGHVWYVGGITDNTPRDLTVNLSFLPAGSHSAELFADGVNAHRVGIDYTKRQIKVDAAKPLRVHMAPGGGFVLTIVD